MVSGPNLQKKTFMNHIEKDQTGTDFVTLTNQHTLTQSQA